MKVPLVRGDCADVVRPCPHSQCRYHLDGRESCALDFADRVSARKEAVEDAGELLAISPTPLSGRGYNEWDMTRAATLVEVADAMGLSKARVQQIEQDAIMKLRWLFAEDAERAALGRQRLVTAQHINGVKSRNRAKRLRVLSESGTFPAVTEEEEGGSYAYAVA